jgi:hypothetical protein
MGLALTAILGILAYKAQSGIAYILLIPGFPMATFGHGHSIDVYVLVIIGDSIFYGVLPSAERARETSYEDGIGAI